MSGIFDLEKILGRLGKNVKSGKPASRVGGKAGGRMGGRGKFRPDFDFDFNIQAPSFGKPANDNAPKAVNGSMGMLGRSPRAASTPTGVMPSFRREGSSPVSSRDSVEKILAAATKYLVSIDASLRAQLLQQQYAYNQSQKQQREYAVEQGGKSSSGGGRSFLTGAFANTAKQELGYLARVMAGLGGLAAIVNFDDLQKKFDNAINTAFKENGLLGAGLRMAPGLGIAAGLGVAALGARKLISPTSMRTLAIAISRGGPGLAAMNTAKAGRAAVLAEEAAAVKSVSKHLYDKFRSQGMGATQAKRQADRLAVQSVRSSASGFKIMIDAERELAKTAGQRLMDRAKGFIPAGKDILKGARGAMGIGALIEGGLYLTGMQDLTGRNLAGSVGSVVLGGLGAMVGGGWLSLATGAAGAVAGNWLGTTLYDLFAGKSNTTAAAPTNAPATAPQEAYDIVYGNGIFGSPTQNMGKSLTQMTVSEVLAFQRNVLAVNTKGNFNRNDGKKHTPVGAYQFTEETIIGLMNQGVIKSTDIFNAATQDRMAEALWNARRGGDLSQTWAYTFGSKPGQYAATPFSSVKNAIIQKEVGSYVGMPEVAAGARVGVETYDSVKPLFERLMSKVGREKMRLMSNKNYDGTPYSSAVEGSRRSSFISERAKMHEAFMRARGREDKQSAQGEKVAASQKAYSKARQSRSEQTKVPNPAYGNAGALNMFAYFQVAGRMVA